MGPLPPATMSRWVHCPHGNRAAGAGDGVEVERRPGAKEAIDHAAAPHPAPQPIAAIRSIAFAVSLSVASLRETSLISGPS